MDTLREWTEFYKGLKIWVYPYMSQEHPWIFWKTKKDRDYYNLSNTWTWNDDIGIKLIVGKKGIRVIELHDRELLSQALRTLKLPEDYLWIIDSIYGLGIVIDTPSVSRSVFGIANRDYENITVLWEGYYVLPSIGIPRYFYKNRMPSEHPTQVTDDDFIACIESLKK